MSTTQLQVQSVSLSLPLHQMNSPRITMPQQASSSLTQLGLANWSNYANFAEPIRI